MRKAFAAPAVHFKGSGWAKKERRSGSSAKAERGGDAGADKAGESKPADASAGGSATAKPADRASD
jgi:predicted nucleic acid-binding Zn ribbon protein